MAPRGTATMMRLIYLSRRRSAASARRGQRGFTLIELVVVVVLIAVLAALAIPSITFRMRDRRTQQAAQMVAQMFAGARMRAMGRGTAVLVRYSNSSVASGTLEVREAVQGAAHDDPNCADLPVSSCLITNWGNGADKTNRLLSTFDPAIRSEYKDLQIVMRGPPGVDDVNDMDVCFTPMGSTYVSVDGGLFSRLSGVPTAIVYRQGASGAVGLYRQILVVPNGNAHLGTSRESMP
jgi:prepilin-type N-terminal cleavage/methylation domain-containing protein